MLENIKSLFFTRRIFLNINETRKLNLIKYNKKLQKKLDINIINYKVYSGRYIIYDTKEKIKIYNSFSDDLIFKGEYFNGKGKEYYKKKIASEGEYLNGKKNGKYVSYYKEGKILFEGEYLNGKKWNIKEYDFNGNIIYELKEGKGYLKEFFFKMIFEGEYLNGERNGKGNEYFSSGELKFEGEYLNGKRHGIGKEYYSNGRLRLEGEFLY